MLYKIISYKRLSMLNNISVLSSVICFAVTLSACSHQNADREGQFLGDITTLGSVYTVSSTNISEVRKILGTPSYEAKTSDGAVYVYSYRVNYPFEGYNPAFTFVNSMKHNKVNALNDEIEAMAVTNKNLALKTDREGNIKKDYFFGYKYLFSRKAKGTAHNIYCVTELSADDLLSDVNFSRYVIEADSDKQSSADYSSMLTEKLSAFSGEKLSLNNNVTINKEDGELIAQHPKLLKNTFCNEITCNK